METFNLKYFKTRPFLITLLCVIILLFILPFLFYDTLTVLQFATTGKGIFIVIAALLIPGVLLRKIFMATMDVAVVNDNLIAKKNGLETASIHLSDIGFIKLVNTQKPPLYQVYNKEPRILFSFTDVQGTDTHKFVNYLKEKCNLIPAATRAGGLTSPAMPVFATNAALQQGILPQFEVKQRTGRKKTTFIIAGVLVLLLGILILPFFINKKAFYDVKDGKVFFGNKELKAVNEAEFKGVTYNVAVDCTRVYFRGEPVSFIDRKSFRVLGNNTFYADKNGLYYETSSLYSKIKLKPLEGDYDRSSFHQLDYSNFYKDKNNLYTVSVFGNEPLKKADLPGVDVASFEPLNYIWFADDHAVYFGTFNTRVCKDIDRASFKVLNNQVAKDKNHVYYITYGLKSDDHAASDKMDDYAILEKADAPSFTLINDNNFVDKNTTWTISKEGEKVEYREGKSGAGE